MSTFPISFDDLDTDLNAVPASSQIDRADISIVNGGDKALTSCPKCNGSGQTRWGLCFRCEGKGRVSVRSAAASKARVTRERNEEERRAQFISDNREALQWLVAQDWSEFFQSLHSQFMERGTLSENQLAAVHRGMAKQAARREEKAAARVAAAPTVNISAIEALFATATNNDIKKPIFRADGIEISLAPASGKNAGALYVKRDGEYAGKIVSGRFHAVYAAPADTTERLLEVAADPLAASVKYARRTGNCGCCGRQLVDPVSIRSGIGPICADKWGLDWRRDLAREELAGE